MTILGKAKASPWTHQGPSPWTLNNGFPKAVGLWWVPRGAPSRREGKALALPSFTEFHHLFEIERHFSELIDSLLPEAAAVGNVTGEAS